MKRELSIGIKLTLINFPSMIQLQSLDLLFSHLTGLVELISDETGMDHSETVKHFKLTMQFFNNEIPQIYLRDGNSENFLLREKLLTPSTSSASHENLHFNLSNFFSRSIPCSNETADRWNLLSKVGNRNHEL